MELDHIRPPRRGGAVWDPENLQSLCRGCHKVKSDGELARPESPDRAEWRVFLANLPVD